ncbi:hypothetical protein HHK36_000200 [Tetracentron sinense]|uniref:Uncharacterized protein n=1 Tax=Tetracentron sinense TaxID=13715 RepID=A0A834ZVG5_TETSI|nr:hypothetical protein HHK36_000200 [Tetracentron sinense]
MMENMGLQEGDIMQLGDNNVKLILFDDRKEGMPVSEILCKMEGLVWSANWSHGSYYATFTSSAGFAAFIEAYKLRNLIAPCSLELLLSTYHDPINETFNIDILNNRDRDKLDLFRVHDKGNCHKPIRELSDFSQYSRSAKFPLPRSSNIRLPVPYHFSSIEEAYVLLLSLHTLFPHNLHPQEPTRAKEGIKGQEGNGEGWERAAQRREAADEEQKKLKSSATSKDVAPKVSSTKKKTNVSDEDWSSRAGSQSDENEADDVQ